MSTTTPRTLAEQLRGWSDEQLARLLRERPDLATPAPADSAQLASRLATRPATMRALDALDALHLGVLEAALHVVPADVASLRTVVYAAPSAVDAAVDRLLALALIWGTPEDLRPVSVLAEVLASPRGPDVAAVPGLLADLSAPARALLDHLDGRDADGRTETITDPVRELRDRRLLVLRDDGRHVTVPWTVRVALRGGRATREPVDVPPPLATTDRSATLVDRAAAGAAFELVRRTELLLDHWGSHPPAALRAGGLGVRDQKATATLLGLETAETTVVVETAHAAGLLALGAADDVDPAWLPTDAYDVWLARSVAERWVVLARAWLANPRHAPRGDERTLGPDLERRWLPQVRRETLAELANADGALATTTGVPSLLARLRWRAPRRPTGREGAVTTTLDEAAFVGMTGGGGGLPAYARELLGGDDAAGALQALLPEPVDHVLIQADLTAVAPGPLEGELARRLATLADVESRGGATVYRFGADSVRRAFDAGWSNAEVKGFLSSASRTPVPQALDYLVDDVSRRFGTLRVGAVEAFLRSDDEAELTSLLHVPASAGLRLRRIAPTVLVSDVTLHVLLPRLRDLGHAPVVEAADGTVRVARPDVFRARSPHVRRPPGLDAARTTARTTAVVAAIRAGDRVAASRPSGVSASSPGDVLALLREAADRDAEVLIDYVDNHGRRTERLVRPARVEAGELIAHDEREDLQRAFAVPRISAARIV